MAKTYNILFTCTGNSARSIMAEAIMNALAKGQFKAYSGGNHPKGFVNPKALNALKRADFPVDGLRSKSWDEFAAPGAPQMDFVITVCDRAAEEACPSWPGAPITAHWGVPDPAAVEGSEAEIQQAFRVARNMLQQRISLLMSLGVAKLDRMALEARLAAIGKEQLKDESRA